MENFGPYEDAMSTKSTGIFHTRISALMNLHRLLPSRVVHDVSELDISLNSKEGFIRQVLGWREFVYQIHRATDGFRKLQATSCSERPGDGGYSNWSKEAWTEDTDSELDPGVDGGACPDYFKADNPLLSLLGEEERIELSGHSRGKCLGRRLQPPYNPANGAI